MGETGAETGTASVNTMGSGHLSGPALHNGWQHSINAGPAGRILVRSFRRWAAPSGRAGLGVGQKSAMPAADLQRADSSHHSLKPCHTSLKFLTRAPSTRSSLLDHLPSPCDVTLGP